MKRVLIAVLLVSSLGACSKTETSATNTTGASGSAKAPPPPFTGALTGDRILGSKDLVRPFDKWDTAMPKLEGQMGKATLVKDDKKYFWGVKTGDDCFYVEIDKQADGSVGSTMDPMKVSKGGPLFNWADCLKAAGVQKDPIEDPNAAGPPTDGKALGVIELLDGAKKARTKWSKAKVTVKGLYMSTTNVTSNGTESANVTITAAKSDLKNTVTCRLADVKTAPAKVLQYTPMTITGTVQVDEMVNGAGETSLDVDLKDCSIAK